MPSRISVRNSWFVTVADEHGVEILLFVSSVVVSMVSVVEVIDGVLCEGLLSEAVPVAAGDCGLGDFNLVDCAAEDMVSVKAFAICAAIRAQSCCNNMGLAVVVAAGTGVAIEINRGKKQKFYES